MSAGWPKRCTGMMAFVRGDNSRLQCGRVHGVSAFVNIDKHRLCSAIGDRLSGGHESVRDREDFVAGSDPQCQKCKPKSIRAAANADGMPDAAVGCEVLFEVLDKWPPGEDSAVDNLLDRSADLPTERRVSGV